MEPLITECATDWYRVLKQERKSEHTVATYNTAIRGLVAEIGNVGISTVTRARVRDYLSKQLELHSASTAATRYRALSSFFAWCVREGELEENPMIGIKAPKVPIEPPDVLTNSEIERLFNSCRGVTFRDRRDAALIHFLLATGARISEAVGMHVEDIDRDAGIVLLKGKGNKRRPVPLGSKTQTVMDRYLRARRRHRLTELPELWLAERGPLTRSGAYQAIVERGKVAGVRVYPHQLRHTFAHRFRAKGGGVDDLMELAGWARVDMALRYGKSAAQERAINAHKRLGIGDDF